MEKKNICTLTAGRTICKAIYDLSEGSKRLPLA